MGHVCCISMTMGLYSVFCVFFCKPVDVVEGISLRTCCSDGGVCNVLKGSSLEGADPVIQVLDGRGTLTGCTCNISASSSLEVFGHKPRASSRGRAHLSKILGA